MSGQDDRLVRRAVDAAARRPAPGPCPDAEALGLYAERLLDADEQQALDGHVAECARCQASLAAFVRGAPEAEVAAAADGVAVGARAGRRDDGVPWWMGWKWLVPVAATAAVAIVAVWVQRPAAPELTMSNAEPVATAPAAPPTAPAGPAVGAREESRGQAQDLAPPPARSAVPPVGASREGAVAEPREAPAERLRTAGTAVAGPESTAKPAAEQLAAAAAPAAPPPPAPAALAPAPAAAPATMADAANTAPRAKALSRADAAAPADAAASAVSGRAEAGRAGAAPQMATLTGRVTYRIRRALPAGAVVDVRLLDVSRADAPADVIGRVEIVTRGEQVPVPFALPYDASRIEPRRRYTVQVTITVDGAVAFRTTTAHAVLTSGAPSTNVEVVVDPS